MTHIILTHAIVILGLLIAPTAQSSPFDEFIRQGDVHDQAFEPDNALSYYLKAERLAPDNASLLVKMARQHVYRMDDLQQKTDKKEAARRALAYAQRAVAAAPETGDPHLSVAICYGKLTPLVGTREQINISSKLKAAAEKALQYDPQNDYAWHLLGRWHQTLAGVGGIKRSIAKLVYGGLPKASYDEAVKCFKRAIKLKPNRLIHPLELGRTYTAMEREREARAWITKALDMPETEKDDPETKRRGRETLNSL